MSEIKVNDGTSEDNADDKDWEAAKAFFENLKTVKPRPVRDLLENNNNKTTHMSKLMCSFSVSLLLLLLHQLCRPGVLCL